MNDQLTSIPQLSHWRRTAFIITLFLVSAFSQIDRILTFILAESIKRELNLSDTQLGLINGIAFAAIYSLLPYRWPAWLTAVHPGRFCSGVY